MRGALASSLFLSFVTAALASWVPLTKRANETVFDCLENVGLDPIEQGEAGYATNAAPFNLRMPWRPAAVVYPNDANGVAAAVKCAVAHGVKVNPRSGGHSYAAFALGGEDGHLTVSLDKLRHLSVSGNTATIGAGNRLGDVALYLWQHGKRAMAHGTCPYVGIGGHAGQGGFGLPSRAWGLLSDQVQSIEIVLADGSIKTASQTENGDLFWAAMGAGANFGIITSFTTKTQKAVDSVAFSYQFGNYGPSEASAALQAWQAFGNDKNSKLDVNVGLQIHVDPSPQGVMFSVSGVYYGADVSKVQATFAPLLQKLGKPTSTSLVKQDWITNVMYLAGTDNINGLNTTLAPDVHDTFYATSTFVSEAEPMTKAASDALFKYFYDAAKSPVQWFAIFDLYGGGDSVINKVGPDYNSFDGRGSLYSIQYYGTIPASVASSNGIAFIQGMKAAVESNQQQTTFREYANYVDSTYSAEVASNKYYPTHTTRLVHLKRQYDLNNVFSFPQSFGNL